MRKLTLSFALVSQCLPLLNGCDSRNGAVPVVVTDSAGVQIVQSMRADVVPRIEDLDSIVTTIPPEVAPSVYLYGVRGMVALSDGRIVLANRGTVQLLFFSKDGEFLSAIGREGSGPGEFRTLGGLFRCGADVLVVDDWERLTFLDSAGGFMHVATIPRLDDDGYVSVEAMSADCGSALLLHRAVIAPPLQFGPYDQRYMLYWANLETGQRDTITSFIGAMATVLDYAGILFPRPVPWGTRAYWSVSNDHVFVGDSGTPEVRIYDRRGALVRIIRWSGEARPLTATERQSYGSARAEYLRQSPDGYAPPHIPPLGEYPTLPEHVPFFGTLVAGDRGLWIQEYPLRIGGQPGILNAYSEKQARTWLVFDTAGVYAGDVTVPASVEIGGFLGGRLGTVWRDSLDLEYVRVHAVR